MLLCSQFHTWHCLSFPKKTFIKEHYVGLNQCLPLLYPHNLLERKNEVKMRKNLAAGEAEKKMIQLIRAVFAFKIILKYY